MAEERTFGRVAAAQEMKKHSVTLENRSRVSITGVEDVESFDEAEIVVCTEMGLLTLKGSDFRISRLNVDSGELLIEGEADSIAYSDDHGRERTGGLFGRLFR